MIKKTVICDVRTVQCEYEIAKGKKKYMNHQM